MADIFVTRRMPQAGFDVLDRAGVRYEIGQEDEDEGLDRALLLRSVRETDVLLSMLTETIDRELLETNPKLRGVASHAAGFNHIDVAAATELGVPISNTPGVMTDATADLTWALLLAVARRIPEAQAYLHAGRWKIWGPNTLLGADVSPGPTGRRKVLGIVGFGHIGQAVARRAAGFDMDVVAYNPHRATVDSFPGARYAELDALLEQSDFVCLHPALTPETHHLIGEEQLRRMKPSAYLINVARGAVVHEAALVRALEENWIAGAALDVFESEPALEPGLTDVPNAVIVPHIGSATKDTRDAMATIAATNALAHLRGERAPDCINPAVYETEAWRRRTQGARA
jgi:glyoxylate reductase